MAHSKRPTLTDEERAERRRQRQELTEQAVAQLRCSDGWQRWLTVRARVGLRRYSVLMWSGWPRSGFTARIGVVDMSSTSAASLRRPWLRRCCVSSDAALARAAARDDERAARGWPVWRAGSVRVRQRRCRAVSRELGWQCSWSVGVQRGEWLAGHRSCAALRTCRVFASSGGVPTAPSTSCP